MEMWDPLTLVYRRGKLIRYFDIHLIKTAAAAKTGTAFVHKQSDRYVETFVAYRKKLGYRRSQWFDSNEAVCVT